MATDLSSYHHLRSLFRRIKEDTGGDFRYAARHYSDTLKNIQQNDWFGCAVFTLYKLLESNTRWVITGDFITQYAAKCLGEKLSPWSTDSAVDPLVCPSKKIKLLIITERPYEMEEILDRANNSLQRCHPGLCEIQPGDAEYSIDVCYDNGLGQACVTVRFIATTTPVFDIDTLTLGITGFEIFHETETIPLLLNRELSHISCMLFKPLIVERLIQNICSNEANIIATPLPGDEQLRQRRWISRKLLGVLENHTTLLNSFWRPAVNSSEDTCTVCQENFERKPAFSFCETCKYMVHNHCILKYISSRIQTVTFITCFTCRKELPIWREVKLEISDCSWGRQIPQIPPRCTTEDIL